MYYLAASMIFNLVLFLCDALILGILYRYRRVGVFLATGVFYAAAGLFTGLCLATTGFHLALFAAYGIFLHTPIVLLGTAVLWRKLHKIMVVGLSVVTAIILAIAGYAFLIEPYWLEITHYEIANPKITRPMRIVVLADIQIDHFGEFEERVLDEALAQKPDVILLAGDYLHASPANTAREIHAMNSYLRKIHFSAPQGVFAVQGNVDPQGWQNIIEDSDITVAQSRQQFAIDDVQLTCLSLGDSYLLTQLKNPDPKAFHVVVGHCPDFALGKIDADLLVAGHTHGGQVRFPFVGALSIPAKIPLAWAAGMTDLPRGGKLFVSRGIGMERGSAPQFRFLCRPELAVIDLVPAK